MVTGSVFNPIEFAALDAGGGLVLTAGDSLTFDTANLQLTGTIGGAPVSFSGVAAGSQGGGVELAVFTFSSVNIGAGAAVDVVGTRGLVLGSQSNFYLGSSISGLAGQVGLIGTGDNVGTVGPGGAGGPGAEGGVRGTSWASNPPGPTRGYGGNGGLSIDTNSDGVRDTTDATPGVGYGGGGIAAITLTERAGGGGGYGGAGGNAPNTGGAGGGEYGDLPLTELYGGSGGGGSQRQTYYKLGHGGGGGGGALELAAAGTLTLDTTLSLTGGAGGGSTAGSMVAGGGGSGGGVILAANQVHLGPNGSIDVSGGAGGAGGDANRHGGGGGGGRVALYAGSLTGTSPATAVSLSGGTVTGNATVGTAGTLHQTSYVHSTFVAPYVRVDFNDMSAGNIHGQAGGMGFSGTWSTATAPNMEIAVVPDDLVAPASTNFRLTQSGTPQTLQGIGNTTTVQHATRSLASPLTDTIWFSFLLEPTADGRGGINLNTGRIISVGSELRTYLGSSTTTKSNVFSSYGETYLVLGRLELDAGASAQDYLQLWVNPDVTLGPENLGTPTLEDLGTNWIGSGGITSFRIETYAGTAGNTTPRIDLITVSSSPTAYLDVTGVPEPSALLLLAIAGAMLCGFRRQGRAR
ncbi:MAG: PEP-CTERM sorting domain-containing protein [Thermoguttaceae bacterium]|nr:PEP-CTERM sorting domain-containing protein [Thermoguttaceae bacterium]